MFRLIRLSFLLVVGLGHGPATSSTGACLDIGLYNGGCCPVGMEKITKPIRFEYHDCLVLLSGRSPPTFGPQNWPVIDEWLPTTGIPGIRSGTGHPGPGLVRCSFAAALRPSGRLAKPTHQRRSCTRWDWRGTLIVSPVPERGFPEKRMEL